MKAKSRTKTRKDNETPEKCLSDDSRTNTDELNNKLNDAYAEFKINREALHELFHENCRVIEPINHNEMLIRKNIPMERRKLPTERFCVLRRAPEDAAAVRPISSLDNGGIKLDNRCKIVNYSILGSVDQFYKLAYEKNKIPLENIPVEFHSNLGVTSHPIKQQQHQSDKENRYSRVSSRPSQAYQMKSEPSDTSALKLWQRRMQERRSLQDHISKKVQRAPEKLVFNAGEVIRVQNELNEVIAKSIPYYGYGHGFRSGSEFWNQHEEVGVDPEDIIFMSHTRTQKGMPGPITHVGTADIIAKEKSIPELSKFPIKKGEYFYQRFQELAPVIHQMDPHQPDMRSLVIKGSKISKPNQQSNTDKDENLDQSETFNQPVEETHATQNLQELEEGQELEDSKEILERQPSLAINELVFCVEDNQEFIDRTQPQESPRQMCQVRKILSGLEKTNIVEYLQLQNVGCSVIRLSWKKIDSYDPFNLENKSIRRFYFNTQDIILRPKQQIDFPVIFKSLNSGIFTETWELCCLPDLTGHNKLIQIHFRGIAIQQDTTKQIRLQIKNHLQNQLSSKICLMIIDDILTSIYYREKDQDFVELFEDSDTPKDEEVIFSQINPSIPYNMDLLVAVKKVSTDALAKENKEWNLDCARLKMDILKSETLKTDKKEDFCDKYHRAVEKMMLTNSIKTSVSYRDTLYKIGFNFLNEFFGNMFDELNYLRQHHNIPELEFKIARDQKKGPAGKSKLQFKGSKKPSLSSSTVTSKAGKSCEPTIITREPTDNPLQESDPDSQNLSTSNTNQNLDESAEHEEPGINKSSSLLLIDQESTNIDKYKYKSLQIIQAMLNSTIDQIINHWVDIE